LVDDGDRANRAGAGGGEDLRVVALADDDRDVVDGEDAGCSECAVAVAAQANSDREADLPHSGAPHHRAPTAAIVS
jgi:hypothetical protein